MAGAVEAGDLTLHGVTMPVTVDVTHIGAGKDPGAIAAVEGTTRLGLEGFRDSEDLGALAGVSRSSSPSKVFDIGVQIALR